MTEDPKISQRYRELPREEPPRGVDEAILAAARRAAETRPAPLVVPSGRRRWYFPLAAAAIIVLAVAVTIHVEREQPDPETVVPPVTAPKAPTDEQIFKPAAKPEPSRKAAPPQVFAPDPKPQPPAAESAGAAPVPPAAPPPSAQADRKEQPAPAAAPPPELRAQRDAAAAETQAADAASRVRESRRADTAAREPRAMAKPAPARPMASMVVEPPERWLERIAELRKQGKHEEADKQLQEFRKRYPDYRIPDAMLERVEKK